MSQRPRIQVTQTQRLQLNTGLQAAIRMLRADAAGLTRYLEEQAAENPHLKLAPPPIPQEWLPRWSRVFQATPGDGPDPAAVGPSLMAHVLDAIDRRMRQPAERRIALALAEALEPSGWLGQTVPAIAKGLDVAPRAVEAVLDRLQEIEPVGLFARNLADCLRLQAQEEGSYDAVMAVILNHLPLLADGDLPALARLAKVDAAQIALRFRLIRAMNPKPGTEFDALAVARPREPDLVARKLASGGWEVALNHSSLPSLHVIETGGVVEPGTGQTALLAAAKAVQRMVGARNATLLRVGREVLQRQEPALNHGAGALVPMTMAEVATALDLHESTVSRVVAGTAVDTSWGMWWLRQLFSAGVGPEGMASAALRDRLRQLIASENAAAPLSDAALAAALTQSGVPVARRTVAKYRTMLKIPPAHRRRRPV